MSNRVTFVIGSLDYGGAERHLVQILPELARRGWDVEVFALSAPGAQAQVLRSQGIKVISPPLAPGSRNILYRVGRLGAAAWSFYTYILSTRPAVVHFYLPQAYLMGGLISLFTGARYHVMSRRSRNLYQRKHAFIARIERLLHRHMDVVLGNSRPVVLDLIEEGVPARRLGLVYNGIDLRPFSKTVDRNDVRQALGIGEGELVIVKVANLIPYKGHEDLLRALSIAKLPASWRLVCVGRDDGVLKSLQGLARDLAIADHVLWTGPRTDIPDLLGAADIGVLASHEEGFSNAVLEYMAAGLPTVVTAVGGNSEAVLDHETGLVVPPGDGRAMSSALCSLIDARVRKRMGEAGRARVRVEFSLERCVANYEELYRALLASCGLSEHLRADHVLVKPGPSDEQR